MGFFLALLHMQLLVLNSYAHEGHFCHAKRLATMWESVHVGKDPVQTVSDQDVEADLHAGRRCAQRRGRLLRRRLLTGLHRRRHLLRLRWRLLTRL